MTRRTSGSPSRSRLALVAGAVLLTLCWPATLAAQAATGTGGTPSGTAHPAKPGDRATAATAPAPTTTTFTRPDTYSYTVPAGVTQLTIVAVGGRGGSCPPKKSTGGGGAAVTAIVSVSPGQRLKVQVGGPGADCGSPDGGAGGFGGGGAGGSGLPGFAGGAGGGGASAVEVVGQPTAPLLWAGGGGGAGGWPTARGGNAAGINSVVTSDMNGGNSGGTAGTQKAGGAGTSGGVAGSGFPGSAGTGGKGTSADVCRDARRDFDGGGGGGGGYFGGGGGGFAGKQNGCAQASGPGGGGGGSSHVETARTRDTLIEAAVSDSPPGVSITDTGLPAGGGIQCLHTPTPPVPGPGEAVFSQPAGDNAHVNVVIIPLGSRWNQNTCPDGNVVMARPTSIKVGVGAAVLLEDEFSADTNRGVLNRYSPWGAADSGGTPPVLFPGGSGWDTTAADVVSPQYLFQVFGSCRSCSLPGTLTLPVQARLPSLIAYQGDLSGADLSGAKLQNVPVEGWNFSGANLTGAQFQVASLVGDTFNRTNVTGTVFTGADLRAATFTSLQYSGRAPSFSAVTVGEAGGKCTVFRDTDLVAASLLPTYSGDCAHSPLLPGSSVSILLLLTVIQSLNRPLVDLAGTRFVSSPTTRAVLAGKDLSGLNLNDVQFIGFPVDLSKANLDGDSLRSSSFEYANLAGATFHNVDAAGASFRGAQFRGGRSVGAATFSGSDTNLQRADFVDADVSGANFSGANLTGAVFSHALAQGTDFNGVRASGADFDGAHIYGNGQAFANATNLTNVDFAGAVLAGNIDQGGGFALTRTDLTGTKFTGAECVSCNFTGSKLGQVNFSGAYLPGAVFAGVLTLSGANFVNAWLYCGDLANSRCPAAGGSTSRWLWPLDLALGEAYGPVPFATTNLTGVSFDDVAVCPDGKAGTVTPAGCAGHLLPKSGRAPPLPAPCSAAGLEACPSVTSTLFNAGTGGSPQAVAATAPPTWATTMSGIGFYAALADGTIRLVGAGAPKIVAGQAGKRCTDPASPCGDGGAATKALLGTSGGLAVGLDGSLYIADPALHRVRRIAPDGQITTVAGDGTACTTPPVFNGVVSSGCGDGKAAAAAQLAGPYGVWVSPDGALYIADGARGLRAVSPSTGLIRTIPNTASYDVRDVVGDATGALYATARSPDYLIRIVMTGGGDAAVTKVVGTGTSGYNGNTTRFGSLAPGTEVQISRPQGLSVGLDGNIVFADTGNSLIRSYEPRSGHVSDVLGGLVSFSGVPQAGFNGDGKYGDQTKLDHPLDVVATAANTYVVADTANNRVREFGPSPIDDP